MINALKTEFRKIFTVRSTYVIFLITFGFAVVLTCFWIMGYKDVEKAALNNGALMTALYQGLSLAGIFLAFLALLSVGHEYRYNTILYALTTNNHRSKIFFSKLLAVNLTALVAAAVLVPLCYIGFYLGQNLQHVAIITQTMPDWNYAWHIAAMVVGSQSLAFVIAALVRSQITSIAVFLIMPTFIEGLLSLLLKENVKYLPFTAIGNLSAPHPPVAYTTSALVVAVYVGVVGLVAYGLFLRRDAN